MTKNDLFEPNLTLESHFINTYMTPKAEAPKTDEVVNESDLSQEDIDSEFQELFESILGVDEADGLETAVPSDSADEVSPQDGSAEPDGDEPTDEEDTVAVPRSIAEKLYDVLGDILNYGSGDEETSVEDEISSEDNPTESEALKVKAPKVINRPNDRHPKPAPKTKFLKNQGSGKGLPKGDSDLSEYIVGKVKWPTSKSKDHKGNNKNV